MRFNHVLYSAYQSIGSKSSLLRGSPGALALLVPFNSCCSRTEMVEEPGVDFERSIVVGQVIVRRGIWLPNNLKWPRIPGPRARETNERGA